MFFNNRYYREDLKTSIKGIDNLESIYGKSVLITGSSGMVASYIIDMLMYLNIYENAEISIYALGRDEEKLKHRFISFSSSPFFNIIIRDVTAKIGGVEKCDYIIHAAGDGYPEAFRVRPVETMSAAIVGTMNLLELAKESKAKRLMFVSSGEVYGQGEKLENGFSEEYSGYVDSMKVRSCYPVAKRAAETLCVSYASEYGVDVVVSRLSHIYGPCFSNKDNRATAQFIRNAMQGEDIVLHSEGKQMRNYTYVADCASGMMSVLINGENANAYNVANKESKVTIAGFAKILSNKSGVKCNYDIPSENEKKELSPIEYALLCADKLEELGWRGNYDIEKGIEKTLLILREK